MPHKPKHRRCQIAEQNNGAKNGQVICRNCGYEWYPDARLWRNLSTSNGVKVVYCPACAVRNRLSKEKLLEVFKRSDLLKRMREFAYG
jgi:late competence protein required for DNA uptake (superfamily II DNA/RNA helicase)